MSLVVAGPSEPPHPFSRPSPPTAAPSVTGEELLRRRGAAERLCLLDVRPIEERRIARLVDDRHIPLAELPGRLTELPTDRPIVVYDQFGGDAERAATLLARTGRPAVAFLEGGLEEYAHRVDPSVGRYRWEPRPFVVVQLPRRETGCLSYFLGDVAERRAVIVDPGESVAPYLHKLREEHWRLGAIVETHTHADHLAGHAALAHATGAPIVVSHASPAQYPHQSLTQGEAVPVGNLELVALETPGHTRDHLTLTFEGLAFTGDTLLIGGCGRTDLGDGDPNALYESLRERILKLPDATVVYPAHYGRHHALVERYASTIGVERATNEALQLEGREAFLRYMTEGWPPKPASFDAIVRANLATFPD